MVWNTVKNVLCVDVFYFRWWGAKNFWESIHTLSHAIH